MIEIKATPKFLRLAKKMMTVEALQELDDIDAGEKQILRKLINELRGN